MDAEFCSRYPFSSDAKQLVSASGLGMSPLVLEAGERRVLSALSSGSIPKSLGLSEQTDALEVASYATARMIVASLKNRFLLNRYAISEAKRAREFLNTESDENFAKIAQELGVHFSKSGSDASFFSLPVYEYLRFSPKSVDYKLVNKPLALGRVSVSRPQLTRLLEEAVRKHVESTMPPSTANFPPEVLETANRVKKEIPKHDIEGVTKVEAGDYPPCIKKLIEDLSLSENLPHTARWTLCTYLAAVGVPNETIIKIFSTAPDFNLSTTAYQVDYIKKRAYSVPSCATVDTYGICVANCHCGSPLYYKKSKIWKDANSAKTASSKKEEESK